MQAKAPLDPRLGQQRLSFDDPGAMGWAAIVLGVTLVIAGGIVTLLLIAEAKPGRAMNQDELAGALLGGLCLLGGGALLFLGVLDKWRKPVWYLCDGGAVRMSKTGPDRLTFWRNVDELRIVIAQRSGVAMGYHLRARGCRIRVPDLDTAQRGYGMWKTARMASQAA